MSLSSNKHNRTATLGHIPFNHPQGNAYVERSISGLSGNYKVVPIPRTRHIPHYVISRKFQRLDFVITSWEDLWISSKRSGRLSPSGMLSFVARLLVLRLVARKVVYIRHDRFPHHTATVHARAAQCFLDMAEHLASIVVTHSPCEARGHREYVPHPLYHGPTSWIGPTRKEDTKPYFIVFGRILPYKGIEALIAAFPKDQRLLIAGPCDDNAYLCRLQAFLKEKPNIEIRASYTDEQTASELVRNARAMLLTSTGVDMVVSGSYFFALSNATPVIAMESAFYRWSIDTNHAPGLIVCKTIDEMAQAVAQFVIPDRQVIADYAFANFGEDVVRRAWNQVLKMGH